MLPATALAVSASAALAGGSPNIDLIARANFTSAFNLPVGSQVVNATPSINDNNELAFEYADLNIDYSIWAQGGTVSGPFFLTSDARINNNGLVTWSVFLDGFSTDGVWTWSAGDGDALFTQGPTSASSWGTPQANNNNDIMWRASALGDNVVVVDNPNDAAPANILAVADGTTYDFIASSVDINDSGQVAGRAFLAGGADVLVTFQDGQPDTIVADTSGQWTGFLNSTDFNNAGQIAALAFSGAGDAIVRFDQSGNETVIAREGVDVDSIQAFSPAIADDGGVAFSAVNAGLEGVWFGNGVDLFPLVQVGDLVMTDAGLAEFTNFSVGPDINNNGLVAFNARASLVGTGKDLGWGIYTVLVPAPGALALLVGAPVLASRRRRA